jgi:hypothetical protein
MNKDYYTEKLKKHRDSILLKKDKSLGDVLIEGNLLKMIRSLCNCEKSFKTDNFNFYCPECETFKK